MIKEREPNKTEQPKNPKPSEKVKQRKETKEPRKSQEPKEPKGPKKPQESKGKGKRRRVKLKSKNEVLLHKLIFFIIAMTFLLLLFLFVENIGVIASGLGIENKTHASELFTPFYEADEEERIEFVKDTKSAEIVGEEAPLVTIFSPKDDCDMITTQLEVTKQPYQEIDSLSEVEFRKQLLILQVDHISSADVDLLKEFLENDISLLFIGLPDENSLKSRRLQKMLGIDEVVGETVWNGIRTASDLLTGTMVQMPNYPIEGTEVILSKNTKVYANALPDKYWNYANDDLPPIIWRNVDTENGGRVYVFNGDYAKTEMGYGIVPAVLSEINDNYIYPVINAYVVMIKGYPYATNEQREEWTRLYSRDKMQIQMELFASQLKKYAKIYDIRLTCFSPDYEILKNTKNLNLMFIKNEILSTRGIIGAENDGVLSLDNTGSGVNFPYWENDMSYWDEETGEVNFPICFESTIEEARVDDYRIGGFASTLGFFSVLIDYSTYLDYSGEDDVWSLYSSEQEVMLGKQQRDYAWMDNVTAKEAVGRMLQLMEMDLEVNYLDDRIEVNVNNFSDRAWFILRSNKDGLKIDHGTIVETGTGCYFVTLKKANATITWEEH